MSRTTRSRRVLSGAAIATAFLLLAGCVSTGGEPSPGAGATGADQRVTWWGWNAFNSDQVIADFEKANPGVTVEFKLYSYDDYVTALRTGLTSNDGPDVFQLQPGDLVTSFGGLAVPLEDHLAETAGADWAARVNAQGLVQLQLDGAQVALPAYMSAAGFIYYNATILDDLGVSVPTNFDEWKAACATIEQAGYDCLAHGAKDAWVNTDVYLSLINSIAPGAVYDAIEGRTAWTGPEFVQAMQSWQDLFTSGIIRSGATAMAEYPDAFSAFLEKKAVFIALGTWNTPGTMTSAGIAVSQETVTETIDSVYLSAPFPAPLAGDAPTGPFGGPDNGWAVSARSDSPEAALAFVEFLSLGDGQAIQAAGGNIPGVIDVPVATDDVVDARQVADIERQQADLTKLVGARQIPYSDLGAALGEALSAVAAGTLSPADAMQQIESVSSSISR